MTRAPVGIGIVGLGFMGRRYARFVSRIEGMELAGVCDIDARLASEVATESGGRVFASSAELAADPAIHGVVVCTPEDRHLEPALAAIAASKALMIEKPIAHSLEAARQIASGAKEKGLPLLVAHLLRFEPRWVATRQRLETG